MNKAFITVMISLIAGCSSNGENLVADADITSSDAPESEDGASLEVVDTTSPTDIFESSVPTDTINEVQVSYARHIDPLIGTGGAVFNLGNAYPGAALPFGLVKVSPDTTLMNGGEPPAFQHCAGYRYEDDGTYGFSHNHLHGTGVPDYGNIRFLPTVGMSDAKTKRYKVPFTHDDEVAMAGYYAVTLEDPPIRAELTATTRCAHHRYEFLSRPEGGTVLIDVAAALVGGHSAGGEVTIDKANFRVEGYNHNIGDFSSRFGGYVVYFSSRFNRAPLSVGTWLDGHIEDNRLHVKASNGPANFGAYLEFDTRENPIVEAQVCLSYVSLEGARAAMAKEMPEWDFDGTAQAAFDAWEKEAAKIEVTGGTDEQKKLFYTAIYHVLQMPTIWTDVDGRYFGFDKKIHQADGWQYMTDISLWDTYRTQNPLLALVWPEWQINILRSLTAMKAEGGYVPKWPMASGDTGSMIGEHAASTAADSYIKGLREFDIETLWAGLKETADGPLPPQSYGGRSCIESYLSLGYCPDEESSDSVSLTLEYAFNDYCMSVLAEALGKDDDAVRYAARAANWKNHWDGSTFLMPRRADGSFVQVGVDEWSPRGYVEGTVWQWNWFVPHDEDGLRGMFDSDKAFVEKLNDFFAFSQDQFRFEMPNAYYFHGNEPDFHAPYMFIRAKRPDLTQKWARWVLESNYKASPDGLSGNDDGGTMAAWYVFTAIGLFPWPCFPHYYLTSPIFDRVVLHLPQADVVVEADGATEGKVYVEGVTWNGKPLPDMWIDHSELIKGGTLKFVLSAKPPNQLPF